MMTLPTSPLLRPWLAIVLCLAINAVGCSDEPTPTRRIQLAEGKLDMVISDRWELENSSEDGRVYVHREFDALRLSIENSTEDFGSPLRVTDVKSLIGKELNREYGGVSTRVSMGGNAMIKYRRLVAGAGGEEILSEEWVIAKPVGYGGIARVAVSLQIPRALETNPMLPALVETLDRQLGDARIPRV